MELLLKWVSRVGWGGGSDGETLRVVVEIEGVSCTCACLGMELDGRIVLPKGTVVVVRLEFVCLRACFVKM